MQRSVSPKVVLAVLAAVVSGLGVFAYRTLTAPSSVEAPKAEQGKGPGDPSANAGPTEEQLRYMREYNARHPAPPSQDKR